MTRRIRRASLAFAVLATLAAPVRAQMMPGMPGMAALPEPLGVPMQRMGSGTTWLPDNVLLPYRHAMLGDWDLTVHGFAFVQADHQGGPRGADQIGSLSWAMIMLSHGLAGGRFQARTMLSLDAAGVTGRGYPLLFQTGETWRGAPNLDRQHPHDALMELAVQYERPVTAGVGVIGYVALSGEPALGPVAFMHRPSAMDILAAPIGHHWQDATHISFGVLTAGVFGHRWKLEASWFNGHDPDEHRWNVDRVRMDSWSARATWNPDAQWSFTAGYGYLTNPESAHPAVPVRRFTASAQHGARYGAHGQWASTLIYGLNRKPGAIAAHSLLLESELVMNGSNTVIARGELVQKTDTDLGLLFAGPLARRYEIGAVTGGYIRELTHAHGVSLGVGASGTINVIPPALAGIYGSRTPLGALLFLRVRPAIQSGSGTHDASRPISS